MIRWQYYPKSQKIPRHLKDVVNVFNLYLEGIHSSKHTLNSNKVLFKVSSSLSEVGYKCEISKKKEHEIRVPVLYGENGTLEKYFLADAYNPETKTVIEVEAGRAFTNNQFLKDLFQACLMDDVDYLVIAVRQLYINSKDYEKIISYFDALFASQRLTLPLKGILIIGY